MRILALLLALSLPGCATDAARAVVADRAADVADQALEDALWLICRGISVGAWNRAIGTTPHRAQAWALLCLDPGTAPIDASPWRDAPALSTPAPDYK